MPSDDPGGRKTAAEPAPTPESPAPASPSLTPRRAGELAIVVAVASAAGWACSLLGVPLPWMVGPLIATALISVRRGSPYAPVSMRWGGQTVVASAVATNLTPETMSAVTANIWLMLLSALLVIPLSFGLAAVVMRASGIDRATALFASLPGGPLEMAALAEHSGGKPALVAFAQTMRIAGIVTLIPPLLILFGAEFVELTAQAIPWTWPGLILVLAVGTASALVLKLFGGANAFFLGPLIGVGALTMFSGPVSPVPGAVIAVAQVALGITLGRMFDRELVVHARPFIVAAASISGLLIGFAVALAAAFTWLGDSSFHLYVLGNAPGSITEMAVAAKGLHLDASLVTAFHVTRILIIIPAAALFYRAFIRLTDWIEARKGE